MIPTEVIVGIASSADSETSLPYLEIQETFVEPPEPKSAERWRTPNRGLGLIAWQVITHPRSSPSYKEMQTVIPEHAAVGHFARSRWTDEAWERTDAVARSSRAVAVVLRTPASFRPGAQNELHMENFVAHAMRPALSLAWEWAPGSWNEPKALALAERIGVIPVVDPLDRPVPAGETIYLRVLGGKSGRKSPSDDQLKKLAEQLRDRVGWIVFANKTAEQDAQRLSQMI